MALKLKIKPQVSYTGVLDFDSSSIVYNNGADVSVYEILKGNKKIEFFMWMDTSVFTPTGSFGQGIIDFCAVNASDYLGISLYESTMRIYCEANPSNPSNTEKSQNLSIDNSYINKILKFEIIKTEGPITKDGSILSVKVNGVQKQTTDRIGLGRGQAAANIGVFSVNLRQATIWDVKITNTDTNILEHYWKGYPDGSTAAAWVDLGNGDKTFNLFFSGVGPHNTRNIIGSYGNTGGLNNRLKLLGDASTLNRLLLEGL